MFQKGRSGAQENAMLPAIVDNNCIQYETNTSTQLHLYGNGLVQGVSTTNDEGIKYPPSKLKRVRVGDDAHAYQQQLRQMSVSNNFQWNKAGCGGTLLNPTYPVSASQKRFCKEDKCGSIVACSAENNLKNAISVEQMDEFSQFLKVQAENMVKDVRELHHKHTVSLLITFENRVKKKLHKRELEIENIKLKNKELEEKINLVALEAQSWQCKAKDNESVANALKCNIQQLMLAQANEGSGDTSEIDDAVSCMYRDGDDVNCLRKQELEKHYMKYCEACEGKEASVMLLPCRHLCLCADCEGCVDICPICKVSKTEAVHVYM